MKLLSNGITNAKTSKNELRTFILYLAPYTLSGKNVCPYASKGCIWGCLNISGRGVFSSVQLSRLQKTKFWAEDRQGFYNQLVKELSNAQKLAERNNTNFAIRLNGTSDIDHPQHIKNECGIDIFSEFPNLKFYDYTKGISRLEKYVKEYESGKYHLTFSRSESNDKECAKALELGYNIAVVFDNVPSEWRLLNVFNGDSTDLRINDPKGVIVGLKAKGKAKKDVSGFVVKVN